MNLKENFKAHFFSIKDLFVRGRLLFSYTEERFMIWSIEGFNCFFDYMITDCRLIRPSRSSIQLYYLQQNNTNLY